MLVYRLNFEDLILMQKMVLPIHESGFCKFEIKHYRKDLKLGFKNNFYKLSQESTTMRLTYTYEYMVID